MWRSWRMKCSAAKAVDARHTVKTGKPEMRGEREASNRWCRWGEMVLVPITQVLVSFTAFRTPVNNSHTWKSTYAARGQLPCALQTGTDPLGSAALSFWSLAELLGLRVATTSSKLGPALQLCLTPLASNITESHIALNLLEFHGSCGLSICSSALKEVQGKSEHTGLEQDF